MHETRTFLFCEMQLLVERETLAPAGWAAVREELLAERVVLDEFAERPNGFGVVAVSGKANAAPAGMQWVRLRQLIAGEHPAAGAACRALGLLHWREGRRFCGACGGRMGEHAAEMAGVCEACGRVEYPGTSPAVIVRIEKDGKLLLARHVGRATDFYTCLAGYVEPGESAEEAVRREVREEAGIEIADVRYAGSQYWPYPGQLMLGFTARWAGGELRLQENELSDAQWFDRAALPVIPPPGSMAHRLIYETD